VTGVRKAVSAGISAPLLSGPHKQGGLRPTMFCETGRPRPDRDRGPSGIERMICAPLFARFGQVSARHARPASPTRLTRCTQRDCGVAGRGRAVSPTRGGRLDACAIWIFFDWRSLPVLHTRCRPVCRGEAYRTCSTSLAIVTCSIPPLQALKGHELRSSVNVAHYLIYDMLSRNVKGLRRFLGCI
jgi:hypothetical protein